MAESEGFQVDEEYLRDCIYQQTIEWMQRQSGSFNIMAVGEDGLGKVTLLETLFHLPLNKLRDAKKQAKIVDNVNREKSVQIVTENLCMDKGKIMSNADAVGSSGNFAVRIMTTVNYNVADAARHPWLYVAEYITKYINQYISWKTTHPLGYSGDEDKRVHCCLYFLPPFGEEGMRRCDINAIRSLQDRVNIIPVLAKSDTYTCDELLIKKDKVAADIDLWGLQVHQYRDSRDPSMCKPLAVIGANNSERERVLTWGRIKVEDPMHSDVLLLRDLIITKNMIVLRKTTKRLHAGAMKPTPRLGATTKPSLQAKMPHWPSASSPHHQEQPGLSTSLGRSLALSTMPRTTASMPRK